MRKLKLSFTLAHFACGNYFESMSLNWGLVIVILAVVVFFLLPKLRQVSVEEAVRLLKGGAPFIDVRSQGEFASVSIPGSQNLPLHELGRLVEKEGIQKDQPVLVFCQSGMRSGTAVNLLRRMGYTQVFNVGSFPRAQKVWMMSQTEGDQNNG